MYVVTRYLLLRSLEHVLKCKKGRIPLQFMRYLVLHHLPIYNNIVSVSDPNDLESEIRVFVEETNDILLDSLEESTLPLETKNRIRRILMERPCLFVDEESILINEVCFTPLSNLVDYFLKQYKTLMEKSDVSLTGHIISLVSRSIPDTFYRSNLCTT